MLPGEAASGAGGGLRAVLGGAGFWEALPRLALEDSVAVNRPWMPDFFKRRDLPAP